MSRPLIGEQELMAAAHGHIQATPTTQADISLMLLREGIDEGEFVALIQTLAELREDGSVPKRLMKGWKAGVLDGLVLGVRATHEAYERAGWIPPDS